MYLPLLKKCLLDNIYGSVVEAWGTSPRGSLASAHDVENGTFWPLRAHTMIGSKRLDNLQMAFETVLRDGIPGDLVETGVWRGGASIFMAGMNAYYNANRRVYVCDSFEGLPPPEPEKWPADAGDDNHTYTFLAVSLEQVKKNFSAYDLLSDNVIFVKGYFETSLVAIPDAPISILRLDGDMYGSTMTVLEQLYDRVSGGGFIIIDDWNILKCRQAVVDFIADRRISAQIIPIDDCSVYWRKST